MRKIKNYLKVWVLNMNPDDYMSRDIVDVLHEFKEEYSLVEYSSLEGDEFLKLPENGIYFQALYGGCISAYRVYLQGMDGFFASALESRGSYRNIKTLDDVMGEFGMPDRNIPSVKIPGLCPTSPGYEYLIGDRVVSFYYDIEQRLINYIHVKLKQANGVGVNKL